MSGKVMGTDEIMRSLEALTVDDYITSEEVELFEQASQRLRQKDNQIMCLQERLRVAESALGSMYLQELIDNEVY